MILCKIGKLTYHLDVLIMPRARVKRYTTGEVAKMFGVTRQTVVDWIHRGKIRAEKTPGGQWRIPEYEIKKFKKRRSKKRR